MASGFGINGGRGRCFPFFQDFARCYVELENGADKESCRLQFEDYQECLYHRKEILRLSLVQKEIDRKEKLQKHEAKKPAAGATAVAS